MLSELRKITDFELLILKGYILTEFCMNCLLESISHNDESDFFKENFSYYAKIKMLNHFDGIKQHSKNLLRFLEILNKIRNEIAHKLTCNDRLVIYFHEEVKKLANDKSVFKNDFNNRIKNTCTYTST